jgi:hypothetical protein
VLLLGPPVGHRRATCRAASAVLKERGAVYLFRLTNVSKQGSGAGVLWAPKSKRVCSISVRKSFSVEALFQGR